MPEVAEQESIVTERPKDAQARLTTVRLLQVLAAAALLLPLLIFSFASLLSYRQTQALANERIERSLDVVQEHALKVFQSINLALETIDDLLENRPESEIHADEARLHSRLIQIQRTLPEVQSIWIFGPTGHPQVMTRDYPASTTGDYSQNDYFLVPRDGPPGVYIGGIHQSVSGGQPYFTFNRARHTADGKFAGVIELSLLPSDFARFYSRLASSAGLQFALIRNDGTMLARFPPPPGGETHLDAVHLDEHSGFRRTIAASPAGGFYTVRSEVDNIERRFGVRQIPGYPVYTSAGVETAQIRNEWMGAMAMHLIFGIPATLFLFGAIIVVLQRSRRLYAEQDRREAAEAVLRQAQKMDALGRLTGGVAHDFNNLLMIIIGNLESVQRQIENGLEGAKTGIDRAIANAMKGAKRAAMLTNRLLAFSRLQPLDPRPLDLNRLLNDLSDFLTRSLGEAISLEIIGAAGLWAVEADQGQLEAALLNLAVNARDAMPAGGKLTIETSNAYIDEAYCRAHADVQPGQYVLIALSDSGVGMPRDILEKAFDPFFTTKPIGEGTGLGLSQVYGFVKQSGGHVKIYSELNEGTTVKIYLPRLVRNVAVKDKRDDTQAALADTGCGERLLVVEDDSDVRGYVVEALRALNYHVGEAHDAEQALALVDGQNFDLLLTDVILPGMNGRQLADKLKASHSEMKVLFMTGYSRNAIVHQGRLDPGVHMLQKPVTAVELARKIRELLGTPAVHAAMEKPKAKARRPQEM